MAACACGDGWSPPCNRQPSLHTRSLARFACCLSPLLMDPISTIDLLCCHHASARLNDSIDMRKCSPKGIDQCCQCAFDISYQDEVLIIISEGTLIDMRGARSRLGAEPSTVSPRFMSECVECNITIITTITSSKVPCYMANCSSLFIGRCS